MSANEDPLIRAGALFSAALMLTVPLSTAVSIVMGFLVFGCWIFAARYRELPMLVRHNPVAASALLLYALLILGTTYGETPFRDSLLIVNKYRELFLLVVLLPFMQDEKYRRWMVAAFIVACLVTLFGSYLQELGILPLNRYGTASIKSRITHNVLMAFFAYYCAHRSAIAVERRWVWIGLTGLAAFDLLVVVQGRTGQLIFVMLMLLFLFQRFRAQRALIFTPLLIFSLIGILSLSGSGARFQEGIENSREFLQGRPNLESSMGQRLYFWQRSVDLISQSPILGYGTGSFRAEFARITGGQDIVSENPHNEYLLIAVQLGGIGLLAYLAFLACQWRYSFDLPKEQRWFAHGVLLSLVINSLLNSTFLDHTEGHWYACLIALSFGALSARPVQT
ncbi:MAG: O-antigen ligase family protein [Gammaproteobacteria bacterium]